MPVFEEVDEPLLLRVPPVVEPAAPPVEPFEPPVDPDPDPDPEPELDPEPAPLAEPAADPPAPLNETTVVTVPLASVPAAPLDTLPFTSTF